MRSFYALIAALAAVEATPVQLQCGPNQPVNKVGASCDLVGAVHAPLHTHFSLFLWSSSFASPPITAPHRLPSTPMLQDGPPEYMATINGVGKSRGSEQKKKRLLHLSHNVIV